MQPIVLDTNFIMTCVKQKIDFFEDLRSMGMEILIPKQVISELKILADRKSVGRDAGLALKVLEKKSFKQIDLEDNKVDRALVSFLEKNKDVFLGTLDRELKKGVMNSKVVIREKKRLEII